MAHVYRSRSVCGDSFYGNLQASFVWLRVRLGRWLCSRRVWRLPTEEGVRQNKTELGSAITLVFGVGCVERWVVCRGDGEVNHLFDGGVSERGLCIDV